MKTLRTPLLAATLAAAFAAGAFAQPQQPAPGQPGPQHMMMMRGDPGDRGRMMEERMARRQADLKARLQLTPAQEGAWTTWTQAMRPAANRPQRPNVVEMARMTTPQRIDKMRELRNQRNAERDRRGDATKAFYAQLSAAQQKVFDEQSFGMFGGGRGGHRGGHPGMHRG